MRRPEKTKEERMCDHGSLDIFKPSKEDIKKLKLFLF
tara:strand:+ start:103 stop:213 length:111 start_codon:yes stop_codon:yes gene_type:complete